MEGINYDEIFFFFFFLLIKVFSIYMHDKEKKRNVVQYYDLCIEW